MKPSILLVEDDINLGFIISDELKLQGYDVKLCMDGVEAMQEFHNRVYHMCVFMHGYHRPPIVPPSGLFLGPRWGVPPGAP